MNISIVDEEGTKTYNPEDKIIIVYLSENDKRNIANMPPEARVYSTFDSEKFRQEDVHPLILQFKEDVERANENGVN
ncbi:MAG: hypothetical protein KAJ01_10440 [Candidatus Hydrogenedentes bacterium]|nr:hypothetical protein [Candidatus Hydrogenedentota bacterium]